jgi:hypothetical protein
MKARHATNSAQVFWLCREVADEDDDLMKTRLIATVDRRALVYTMTLSI